MRRFARVICALATGAVASCAAVAHGPRPDVRVTLRFPLGDVETEPSGSRLWLPAGHVPTDACVRFGFGCS